MRFNDIVRLDMKRVIDQNGFAHVPTVITRVGIQQYREDQLGLGLTGNRLVNVFRGPDTVFHRDTVESFKHLPVTDGHPPQGVSPQNAAIVQGGHIGEDVQKMDELSLGATLHLTDEAFISRSKGSETSAGYDAEIIRQDGEHEGERYEYKFDGAMLGNHLALVDQARCGAGCRVLDEKHNKEHSMEAHEVKAIVDAAIAQNNEAQKTATADAVTSALQKHQDALDAKAEADAQAKLDEENSEQAKKDKADTEKQIKADAKASAELRLRVKPLLGDKFDDEKSDKDLLVLCFDERVKDAQDKSVDYLIALLDQESADRTHASGSFRDSRSTTHAGAVRVRAIV